LFFFVTAPRLRAAQILLHLLTQWPDLWQIDGKAGAKFILSPPYRRDAKLSQNWLHKPSIDREVPWLGAATQLAIFRTRMG
jgi:hypothetical protein